LSSRHHKKHPKPKGKANLFGIHAVSEAWSNPDREITKLFLTEKMLATFENSIKNNLPSRPEPQVVDRKFLDKILDGAVHQGIAINAKPLPEVFVSDMIAKTASKERACILMLDQVTDPHNVGAIMRSACAFGADGLIMQRKHSPMLEGVLAKTACGAAEHLDVAYEINLSDTIDKLKAHQFNVLGLDEKGTEELGKMKQRSRTVIVLGAEGKGLRPKVKEHCDQLVRLPTSGPIMSLNVSNAAAISLYQLTR
jgi:23S rRNA (guanosine2251-2'-O)-methyltransferase